MPHENKNNKILRAGYANQNGSKRILIEHTTLLLFVAFVIFKIIVLLSPDGVLPYTLNEFLLSFPTLLKTYPAFTGVLLSFITWHVMYFDSAIPGVNPPTPLSPAKYKDVSGANFHLNYLFALLVGPLVATLFYLEWV